MYPKPWSRYPFYPPPDVAWDLCPEGFSEVCAQSSFTLSTTLRRGMLRDIYSRVHNVSRLWYESMTVTVMISTLPSHCSLHNLILGSTKLNTLYYMLHLRRETHSVSDDCRCYWLCICMCTCIYIYIVICIYVLHKEREREREVSKSWFTLLKGDTFICSWTWTNMFS